MQGCEDPVSALLLGCPKGWNRGGCRADSHLRSKRTPKLSGRTALVLDQPVIATRDPHFFRYRDVVGTAHARERADPRSCKDPSFSLCLGRADVESVKVAVGSDDPEPATLESLCSMGECHGVERDIVVENRKILPTGLSRPQILRGVHQDIPPL